MFMYELEARGAFALSNATNINVYPRQAQTVPVAEFKEWVEDIARFVQFALRFYPEARADKELFVQYKNTEDKFDCELIGWNLEVVRVGPTMQISATPAKTITLPQLMSISDALTKWSA